MKLAVNSFRRTMARHALLTNGEIAAQLGARPDEVRSALADLRDSGLVDVLSVGDLDARATKAASYWRLTDAGRSELARRRSE